MLPTIYLSGPTPRLRTPNKPKVAHNPVVTDAKNEDRSLERDKSRQPSVLHVTEAFGAGVATAMSQYATSLPELRHEALVSAREESVSHRITDSFAKLTVLESLSDLSREYRLRDTPAEIIHCHSSWAGTLVRLTRRPRYARIVYSPHALAHSARRWYEPRAWTGAVEWALRTRADAYGAVSTFEASQLMRLGIPISKIFVVPHFVPLSKQERTGTPDTLVAVGRICPQKNPAFFAEVAKQLRSAKSHLGTPLRFYWIGAGDAAMTRLLEESGVTVTGWIDREELLGFIGERAITLVHGAHYEGLPLALIEAMSLGVPVVARRIPSLADLNSIVLVDDARAAAAKVRELIATDGLEALAEVCRHEIREKFSLAAQRKALLEMYGMGEL